MTRRVLVTGSAGFVGSHTVEHLLENTNWDVLGVDSLRHGGFCERIHHLKEKFGDRYQTFLHDFNVPVSPVLKNLLGHIDYVLNIASNSHVDHSIENPAPFIQNNVNLMLNVLEFAQRVKAEKIVQCSTDEVFGPALPGHYHTEWEPFLPSNPYSASKVAQEAIGFSYWRTYNLPIIFTRCMNMIGERQGKEKFLPLCISKIMKGEVIPIHGSTSYIGSRMYLHAKNLADAWLFILKNVEPTHHYHTMETLPKPEAFNIIGNEELNNLELAELVADVLGMPLKYDLVDFHSTRPGHDARYALSPKKIFALGWQPPMTLRESIERIVKWTKENPEWA